MIDLHGISQDHHHRSTLGLLTDWTEVLTHNRAMHPHRLTLHGSGKSQGSLWLTSNLHVISRFNRHRSNLPLLLERPHLYQLRSGGCPIPPPHFAAPFFWRVKMSLHLRSLPLCETCHAASSSAVDSGDLTSALHSQNLT